ncbi:MULTISPECIES: hypothetical protein [Acinetobacter]|jgi:hypothetical protein|uniref:Uncharacterized protein n=1 Tax=Acinetobacter nematophilus TaxID=2994642 RepID=A0A9X3DYJ0_9GAMM|nr:MULTISPECIES: hypothetical protein [Acinetobacter]MBJ9951712.1 hypothetical protein [Acinetobacter baumannii]MCX5469232.1 hypothetical protein [Acinetobacter nematophilus]
MTTLTISQIFEKFSFYQENYLSILQNPEQYHIEVEQAYLDVWPFSEKKLYLGDLLQLWFSEKWLINSTCRLLLDSSRLDSSNSTIQSTQKQIQRTQDLYLFQLSGSTLSGSNHAQVWSVSEQKVLYVSLNSIFKYYCYFESIERPKNYSDHQFKTFGQVI